VALKSSLPKRIVVRKMAGGGLRQAGFMAAAASYALDHHVLRLAEDHQLMAHLAQGLSGIPGFQIETPETNILFVNLVDQAKAKGAALQAHLKQEGIDTTGLYRLRFVTHLDVDRAGVDRAIGSSFVNFSMLEFTVRDPHVHHTSRSHSKNH
jgi:threonine aldolase